MTVIVLLLLQFDPSSLDAVQNVIKSLFDVYLFVCMMFGRYLFLCLFYSLAGDMDPVDSYRKREAYLLGC